MVARASLAGPADVDQDVDVTVAGRSTALLVSVATMGIGGLLFNSIAARVVDVETLGVQASLFFWVTFANQVSTLGLPVLVARLGRHREPGLQRALLNRACIATIVSSMVIGLALVPVAVGTMRSEVRGALDVWGPLVSFGLLVAIVAGFSLTLILEIRLMAIGLGRYVIARAVVVNIARCALLAVPAFRRDAIVLLLLNAGINAISGALSATVLLVRSRREASASVGVGRAWSSEFRFATITWVGGLALVAAQYGFPIIANITLAENAAFYLAWQITAMVFVIPVTIGHAVIAEASRRGEAGSESFRRGLTLSLVLCGSVYVVSLLLARPMAVLVFGAGYEAVADLLPLLVLASLPWSYVALYLAQLRAEGAGRASVVLGTVYGVVVSAMAVVIGDGRPVTSARVWCVAHMIVGAAAVVAKTYNNRQHRWKGLESTI